MNNLYVLQAQLNPEQVDALRDKVFSIPTYSQEVTSGPKAIVLPVDSIGQFGDHFPWQVFARHPEAYMFDGNDSIVSLSWQINISEIKQEFVDCLSDCSPVGSKLYHSWDMTAWGAPCPELGVLRYRIACSFDQSRAFLLSWYYGFLALSEVKKTPSMVERYKLKLRRALRNEFAPQRFPGVNMLSTDGMGSTLGVGADIKKCWNSLMRMEWIAGGLRKQNLDVNVGVEFGDDFKETERDFLDLARIEHCYRNFGISTVTTFRFTWRGLIEPDPDWLKMGSLSSRLKPRGGPIEMPLGSLKSSAKTRAELYLYTLEEGSILVLKGGNDKLAAQLDEHFGVRWLKGIAPITVNAKLVITEMEPPKAEPREPIGYRRLPKFFKAVSEETLQTLISRFESNVVDAQYLDGYPNSLKGIVADDLKVAVQAEKDPKKMLSSALVRWKKPHDWTWPLDGILKELADVSYGLFSPENIQVHFEGDVDDDEGSAEPGSEVRISFDFAGRHHKVVGEFFHGAVPYELLPFIRKVMEEHCNGVAFRPIFGEGPAFALCTAGALDRLKKVVGVLD